MHFINKTLQAHDGLYAIRRESLSQLTIFSRALQQFLIYLTSQLETFKADSTRHTLEMRASTSYLISFVVAAVQLLG